MNVILKQINHKDVLSITTVELQDAMAANYVTALYRADDIRRVLADMIDTMVYVVETTNPALKGSFTEEKREQLTRNLMFDTKSGLVESGLRGVGNAISNAFSIVTRFMLASRPHIRVVK
jgi:hypothetical protein